MKKKYYLSVLLLIFINNIHAQVPANDDCANAILIDQANYSTSQDATNATNNAGGIDVCGSPAWGMNDGVWYKFVGTAGDVNLSVVPSGWNCQVDVYSGSCGNFTCVLGLNDGGTDGQESGMFFADSGVEYFINIGHWAYDSANPQADSPEGPFTMTVNGAIASVHHNQIDNFTIFMNNAEKSLQLTANEKITNIIIYDLLGQQIFKSLPNKLMIEIDFSTYKKGLYLVRVQTLSQSGTYKIINQ